jgi:hypothetical protein
MRGRLDDDLALVLPQPGLLIRRTLNRQWSKAWSTSAGVDWLAGRVVHSGSVMNR